MVNYNNLTAEQLTACVAQAIADDQIKVKQGEATNQRFTFEGFNKAYDFELLRKGNHYLLTSNYYEVYDPDEIEVIGGFEIAKRSEQPNGYKLLTSDKYNYRNLIIGVMDKHNKRIEKWVESL